MTRRCEISGKTVMTGNNVSHAHNKTRRRFLPNLQKVTLISESLGEKFSFRLAASTVRTIEHKGGLDAFLVGSRNSALSPNLRRLKERVKKAAEQAAA